MAKAETQYEVDLPDDFGIEDLHTDLDLSNISFNPVRVAQGKYRVEIEGFYNATGRNEESNRPWARTDIRLKPIQRLDSTAPMPDEEPDSVYDTVWLPADAESFNKNAKRTLRRVAHAMGFTDANKAVKQFLALIQDFNPDPDNPMYAVCEIGLRTNRATGQKENFVVRWGEL